MNRIAMSLRAFVLALFIKSLPLAYAQKVDMLPPEFEGVTVARTVWLGLSKTKDNVVTREVRIQKGETLTQSRYVEAIQRLWNLQIFSSIQPTLAFEDSASESSVSSSKQVVLTIAFKERWTTLPIVRALSGGGTTSTILGLYDIHSFGRYLELGGQYENLSGNHSGVVWFREPRFLDQFLRVGGDFWLNVRNRDSFDSLGEKEGAFTLTRKRIHLFSDKEFHRYFRFGVGFDLQFDRISDEALSADRITLNQVKGNAFNFSQNNYFMQVYTQLGRLDYEVYNLSGYQSLIEYDQALKTWGSTENVYRVLATNQAFWKLPLKSNLGLMVRLGYTNTQTDHNLWYLGGFESVRGYVDGKFKGQKFWQTNLEYRIPSLDTPWLVCQHVVFADAVQTDQSGGPATSIGSGVRFISPKVFRLNVRLDAAYGFRFGEGLALSFGTQQFF